MPDWRRFHRKGDEGDIHIKKMTFSVIAHGHNFSLCEYPFYLFFDRAASPASQFWHHCHEVESVIFEPGHDRDFPSPLTLYLLLLKN